MESVEAEPRVPLERRRRLHLLARKAQIAQREVLLLSSGLVRRLGSEQFPPAACLCLDLVSRSLAELQAIQRSLLSWSHDRATVLTLLAVHNAGRTIIAAVRRVLIVCKVHARRIAAERLVVIAPSSPFIRGYRHFLARSSIQNDALGLGKDLVISFFTPLVEQLSPFTVGVRVLLINFIWNGLLSGILDGIIAAQLPFDREGIVALAGLVGAMSSEWFPIIKRKYEVDTLLVERGEWDRVRGVLACLSGNDARARALGLADEEAVKWRALFRPRALRTVLECWRARNAVFVEPDLNSRAL